MEDTEVAIKVITESKNKRDEDADLDAFELRLRERAKHLSKAIRDSERLCAEDFSITVTV